MKYEEEANILYDKIIKIIDNKLKEDIVYEGNLLKFSQNPILKKFLMETKDLIIVEASPYDKIWGIGMSEDDSDIHDELKWKGQNLLGKAIMKVREQLV